jgi:LytTr DNA-binding domain
LAAASDDSLGNTYLPLGTGAALGTSARRLARWISPNAAIGLQYNCSASWLHFKANVTAIPDELPPTPARKIVIWQMSFFAALLTVSALDNSYSVFTDYAREGDPLPLWKPAIWEFSSHLLVWLLIPGLAWCLSRFPFSRESWWRSLPAHVLATVPFSLLHTQGMVLLRKFAYWIVGDRYDFGPFWDNWIYEYRKDFLTYFVIIGALLAFRIYGLWLEARQQRSEEKTALDSRATDVPLGRLVVRKHNREFILDADDIDRIDADGNYVVVYAGGQSYRLRESLDGLSRRLGEQRFARVHRTHVVNIDRIREIQPWDHGDYRIVLKDGSFLNFSRRYRSRLSHLFR